MNFPYKKSAFFFLFLVMSVGSFAQDFQFSQFYNVPLYINPAFAGSLHNTRVGLHQRLQWPKLDAKYTTSVLSVDHYFNGAKSGVGLMVMQDFQGGGMVSSSEIHLMYSYEMVLNKKFTFRPGIQLGYVSRRLAYAQLRYPHQYDNDQGMIYAQDPDINEQWNRAKGYADVAAGGMLYSKNFWFGVASHHLNTPNQSFHASSVSKLHTKVSFTSGYKIVLHKEVSMHHDKTEFSITPTAHYKFQGKSDQLDLGIYGAYNEFLVGIWYRGIPIKRYEDYIQANESTIFFIGFKGQPFRFGYSYDYTISRLVRAGTGGSHEFNLTYVVNHKRVKKKKILKRLPCPSF
ncbi:MAG: type IX secretion system membrane protein PorP/SprF [Cytophagaceae bacterium]